MFNVWVNDYFVVYITQSNVMVHLPDMSDENTKMSEEIKTLLSKMSDRNNVFMRWRIIISANVFFQYVKCPVDTKS